MRILLFIICLITPISMICQGFQPKQKIRPGDWNHRDEFGGAVAISGDYAVVGSKYHDFDSEGKNEKANAGAAFIFKKQYDGSWKEIQKLSSNQRIANSWFGYDVDINGKFLIVGAIYDELDASGQNGLYQCGAAYIYEKQNDSTWVFSKKITASDRKREGQFGSSVSIDRSGIALVCGHQNANNSLRNGGSFFFTRATGQWAFDKKIDSREGWSCDLSANKAVSGAERGANVYVFKKNGSGTWVDEQTIKPTGTSSSDRPGSAVAISDQWLLIGAPYDNNDENGMNPINDAGSIYIYRAISGGNFQFTQKLVSPNRHLSSGFGYSIDLDQNMAIVGLPFDETDENYMDTVINAGSAFILELDTNTNKWRVASKIAAIDRESSDNFGISVGISGNNAMCGAIGTRWSGYGRGSAKSDAGGTYVFQDCSVKIRAEITKNSHGFNSLENFDNYRWYDCNKKIVIENETNSSIALNKAGNYALIGYTNGCADTSACQNFVPLGISNQLEKEFVTFYPNPVNEILNINYLKSESYTLLIRNLAGELVYSENVFTKHHEVSFNEINGIYFLELISENGNKYYHKLIKSN